MKALCSYYAPRIFPEKRAKGALRYKDGLTKPIGYHWKDETILRPEALYEGSWALYTRTLSEYALAMLFRNDYWQRG